MAWYNPLTWGSSGNTRSQGYQNEAPSGYSSEAAAAVNFDAAMTVSACWASVRLLSETVSAMPIKCYKKEPDGSRSEVTDYSIWRTLNYQPNRYQTRTEFFESLMLNLVTDGNAYILLGKTTRGINSYLPLMSAQMEVYLNADGSIRYEYSNANSEKKIYTDDQIWHIKLFGNGLVGMSPLAYARQSLGVAIATENRVSKIAKNGGKVSGVLSIDKVLTDVQRKAVRANMADIAEGSTDTLKILEAGMEFQQIALSPQDMQMIENRRFSVEDIARFFGVPSVLINDTAGSTVWGSGIGEINKGFYKLNLKPYLERIESSMKRHLMPIRDWDNYDIEFDFDSLLRASYEERIAAKSAAINSGQLTPNEARNDEGKTDKEGGNDIYLNGSLVKAGQEKPAAQIQPMEAEENENDPS